MIDAGQVRERLAVVEARIDAAGGTGVDVLAVTKGFGADAIDAAVAVGCRRIGENYAQELLDKLRLVESPSIRAAYPRSTSSVGCSRTRCARSAASSTCTSRSIGRRSSTRSPDATPAPECSCRSTRRVSRARADARWLRWRTWSAPPADAGLRVEGLMTVGPTEGGPEAARDGFRAVRQLTTQLGLRCARWG